MRIVKKKTTKKKNIVILMIVLILIIIAALVFYIIYGRNFQHTTPFVPERQDESSLNESKTASSSSESSISSPKDKQGSTEPASPPASGTKPTEPSGTFVSNHHPNLDGSPAPSTISSVCHTTPGVSCAIEFTNGTKTLTLSAQTTDINGNTSWDWDVNTLGLTTGEWTITAKAVNGSLVSTSTDSLSLSVGP